MRSEQLEYLLAIDKYGNMRKAAEHINLTPQALSHSIKTLEDELGLKILHTDNKGVKFTDDGKTLLTIAHEFIRQIDELKEKSTSRLMNTFEIYIPKLFEDLYFNKMTKSLLSDFKNISVVFYTFSIKEIMSMLLHEEIEFSFYSNVSIAGQNFSPEIDANFTFEPLVKNTYKCICSHKSPLANYSTISLKTALKQNVMAFDDVMFIIDKFSDFTKTKPKVLKVSNLVTSAYAVENDRGIAFLPYSATTNNCLVDLDDLNCKVLKLKENVSVDFGIIYKKGTIISSDSREIIQYIKQYITR